VKSEPKIKYYPVLVPNEELLEAERQRVREEYEQVVHLQKQRRQYFK
jgi:hypothetical protein